MFDSLIQSNLDSALVYVILAVVASLGGFVLSLVYKFVSKGQGFSSDMVPTLIIIPIVVASVVEISRRIGLDSAFNTTTIGVSLAGIICIARFRSIQKNATELTYILTSIIFGFITGLGYVAFSIITLVLVITTLLIIKITKYSQPSEKEMNLKIIVPEDLNFDHLFDDILSKYCHSYVLKSVKTTEFGTLFELFYVIVIKDCSNNKEMIDSIRERNGNLNILLTQRRFNQVNDN